MENQISHILADRLTSRPKGFGDKTIKKLLKLRILKENNKNIIKAYLGNFNKDKIITINKPVLNWSMFNPRPSTVTIGKKATISVAQRY